MSTLASPQVVVVGGGIAGLAAAHRLAGRAVVTVLETAERLGGKLAAISLEGVRLDGGAESFLARRPEALALVAELGLSELVVHPTGARPAVYIEGRARQLPPTLLGVPTELGPLSSVLTPEGYARARLEPERDWPPLDGDVAVGRLVDEHFGPEVTDRLVEPMLGGVYAGQARELSLAAVAPGLFEGARSGGSLLRNAVASARSEAEGPVFAGLAGGVSTLIDALSAELTRRGVVLRTGVTVRALSPRAGGGFLLTTGPVPAPEMVTADAVVVATPAPAAGRLLGSFVPVARLWAEGVPYTSVAVLTLVVEGVDSAGSGLLVPTGALPTIKAVTYSSTKWAWVHDIGAARWGPDVCVVRVSVGRRGEERALQLPDEALVQRTFAEASGLPGWDRARLITGHVSRWGGALPQYLVGHRDRVRKVREALETWPGLAVCGAGLEGVGIAACVAGSDTAASRIEHALGRPPTDATSSQGRPG